MNIELNQKMIKEMCGNVSFKRGDSFYRADKVLVEVNTPNRCEAVVVGKEDFHVTIVKDQAGEIQTKCSCPTLGAYEKDCQHIAAVLISIYDQKRQEKPPVELENRSSDQVLTEDLLTIFKDRPTRSTGRQLHFENRKELQLVFTCKVFSVSEGQDLLGIEVMAGSIKVQHIRDFLKQISEGNTVALSASFTYDPNVHYFQTDEDAVIWQLIELLHNENVYMESLPNKSNDKVSNHLLLIPPSSWETLLPLLTKVPFGIVNYNGKSFDGLSISSPPLPLQFEFVAAANNGYQLLIKGMDQLIVLNAYRSVLYEGTFIKLKNEECTYLADLKKMLDASQTNTIAVPQKQVGFFMERVVPGLKKLGQFHLSEELSNQYVKTPLVAKLYLDRVKNRLLAGLEFHYGHVMINPVDSSDVGAGLLLIRDEEKEKTILELMEDSSFAKTSGGYLMHNEALEYEFLYHALPKIQQLVQVYATTAVRARVTKGTTPPRIKVKLKKERINWLEFKFEMEGIPEQQIKEILAALEVKQKYYRLRNGSLLSLETSEFEEIQRFLNAIPVQEKEFEDAITVPITRGLQLLDSADDRVFTLEESFRAFLQRVENPDQLTFTIPEALEPILREYQKHGFKWMKTLAESGFGGVLADDMGLGKTLQSIAYIMSELPAIRENKQPALIVCPSSLTYNWLSELRKFTPELQAVVVDGSKTERAHGQKKAMDLDVVITSYPLLRSDIQWFEKQTFHTVFFDEAQAFKNPTTQTAKTVKKIQANQRFALTGTPVENSLEELWSIFHVVFPELFQGFKEYSNLTRKQIARRIRPFLLRRMKEDVLADLPEKVEAMESMELLPDQKKLYASYLAKLRHDTFKHLDRDTLRKNRIKILAGITRLRQICCHPSLFVDDYEGSSAKFEQLKRILAEAKNSGRRVLIFSQFTKMLELIGRDLTMQGMPFFYLDGQTPSEERVTLCNRFNAGERDLFLISLKAGGTGLNLTGADTVILYDLWWNPAVEEQAADRAHRIGQTKAVQVIKLVARGTIEEKMNDLQEKKRHLIEEIIDPNEKATSALTEEDIREILML